jgi:hypothetical protein
LDFFFFTKENSLLLFCLDFYEIKSIWKIRILRRFLYSVMSLAEMVNLSIYLEKIDPLLHHSITIAGLNGKAVADFACSLESASVIWTGTANSFSKKAFADSNIAISLILSRVRDSTI